MLAMVLFGDADSFSALIILGCILATLVIGFGLMAVSQVKRINKRFHVLGWDNDDLYITCMDVDGDDL